MKRRILIILVIILAGCNLKRSYRNNGNVAFTYKGKSFEIEGKYLSEYPKNQYYILFDSIQIRKSDVTEIVVQFSKMDDMIFIDEEDEYNEEFYYDEYWLFVQGKEIIKLTDEYLRENPELFK